MICLQVTILNDNRKIIFWLLFDPWGQIKNSKTLLRIHKTCPISLKCTQSYSDKHLFRWTDGQTDRCNKNIPKLSLERAGIITSIFLKALSNLHSFDKVHVSLFATSLSWGNHVFNSKLNVTPCTIWQGFFLFNCIEAVKLTWSFAPSDKGLELSFNCCFFFCSPIMALNVGCKTTICIECQLQSFNKFLEDCPKLDNLL